MPNDIPEELLFSAAFPLPFRVLSLAGLGILGWASNIHGLRVAGIDARAVLDLDYYDPRHGRRPISPLPLDDRHGTQHRRYDQGPASIYGLLYKLCAMYAWWCLLSWSIYRYATYGDLNLVDAFKFIPAVAMLVVVTVLVSPFNIFAKSERDRFFNAIHRCLFPPRHRVHFADVVSADVLTSFAKVIGDLWLSFCMLMPGGSLLVQPTQAGLARWILPTLMSLPYAVRFRQCLIDYRSPTNDSRRPLFNALKYATSFPVIFLSAAQRTVISDPRGEASFGDHVLFRLWLFAALLNSLYSFWWDITNDWGFDLLLPRSAASPRPLVLSRLHSRTTLLTDGSRSSSHDVGSDEQDIEVKGERCTPIQTASHPFGLRPTLMFPLPVYPFAIVADLVLRLTWSAKLSSHLHAYAEGHMLIFCFEFAEVVRRWMWVFIRVEWEIVKESKEVRAAARSPPGVARMETIGEDEYELVPSDCSGDATPGG
ncbi:EXS-domain-containing protein [Wolfiporia cocos MD-104 SS10]|uniref:EXS-domain-containing protein n=1 Tax=Wolfiporia cocos (strain MD-104) TaxID=742152 RepID=A0A2H3K0K0_WOLCO|nr:EXS-domain-containing protein [Wolfiporia cocos MD-104 SS10]